MPASGDLRMQRIREQNAQLHGKLDAYKEAGKNVGIIRNLIWSLRKKDDTRRVSEQEAKAEIEKMQEGMDRAHGMETEPAAVPKEVPDLSEEIIRAAANGEPPETVSELLSGLSPEELSELIRTNETHHTMEILLEEHAGELPFENLSRDDRARLLLISDAFREQYKDDPSIRSVYAEWEQEHAKPQETFFQEEPERSSGIFRETSAMER